jgi:hypothetical protein
MRIHSVVMCLSLVSLSSSFIYTCDQGGTDGEFVPCIRSSDIKKYSYSFYKNATGQPSKNWDEVADSIIFKNSGTYAGFSNAYRATFELYGQSWSSVKDYCTSTGSAANLEAVARAVYMKFAQNSSLKSLLLGTGSKILVDDSDKGMGNNNLGRILMIVRSYLQKQG